MRWGVIGDTMSPFRFKDCDDADRPFFGPLFWLIFLLWASKAVHFADWVFDHDAFPLGEVEGHCCDTCMARKVGGGDGERGMQTFTMKTVQSVAYLAVRMFTCRVADHTPDGTRSHRLVWIEDIGARGTAELEEFKFKFDNCVERDRLKEV